MRFISIASTAAVLGLAGCAGHTTTVTRPASVRTERLGPLIPCTLPTIDEPLLCGELGISRESCAAERANHRALRRGRAGAHRHTGGRCTRRADGRSGSSSHRLCACVQPGASRVPPRSRRAARRSARDGAFQSTGVRIVGRSIESQRSLSAGQPTRLRCAEFLFAITADLSRSSTAHAADDLEAVRAWLGYQRLDLFWYSYGTRVAVTCIRRFPQRVQECRAVGSRNP